MFFTILLFIAVLGLLVFVHEFGHFWTAKKMGMKVEEFGFGFPPRIWGRTSKKDGVFYSINWIPLGGFVRIKGEDGSEVEDPDSFAHKKPWQRFIVLIAGVAMNFLLCALLFIIGFTVGLPQSVTQADLDAGRVRDHKVQIVNVLEGKPAADAGVELGDVVRSVDGTDVQSIDSLIAYSNEHVGDTVAFSFDRDGTEVTKDIEIVALNESGKGGIGIGLIETGIVSYPWWQAIYKGFETSIIIGWQIIVAFAVLIKNLLIGNGPGGEVSGPVGIAVLTGQVAQLGFVYLLQFTAILSLNLAIINILPFPALDGGRILFVLIEKIIGKPIKRSLEAVVHTVGFSLLMILIVVITFQDILKHSTIFSNLINGIF